MGDVELVLRMADENGAGDVAAVVEHVRAVEHEAIANHSIRTYLYAADIARREASAGDVQPLALTLLHACLLHDIGTIEACDGPLRFEVEGGDAAVDWLAEQGFDATHQRQVWEAIALHTTPHVAEQWGGIVRFTRLGVRADFGEDSVPAELRAVAEESYPRLDIELVLGRAVVQQAVLDPRKAPRNSWPGNLLRELHEHLDEPDGQMRAF